MRYVGFLLLLAIHANALEPEAVYKNNQAERLFEEDRIQESKDILQKEVVDHPQDSILHFNLGLAHETDKEGEKALQEYNAALKNAQPEDKEMQFRALFNMARLYGEKSDLPNALKYYQRALDIKPDSEEVKTNIELLMKSGGGNSDKNQQQQQQQKQDQNQSQQQQKQKQQDQQQQKRQQPQQFQSKELSEQDVKKIFDELKRQEEQIRAKINNDKVNNKEFKEKPPEKDW